MIFTKKQRSNSSNSGYKIQKIRGGKIYPRTRVPKVFKSKDGTTRMKYWKTSKRDNFYLQRLTGAPKGYFFPFDSNLRFGGRQSTVTMVFTRWPREDSFPVSGALGGKFRRLSCFCNIILLQIWQVYKFLPINLGACKPIFFLFYFFFIHHIWSSEEKEYYKALFLSYRPRTKCSISQFFKSIVFIQYSGPSKHAWTFN